LSPCFSLQWFFFCSVRNLNTKNLICLKAQFLWKWSVTPPHFGRICQDHHGRASATEQAFCVKRGRFCNWEKKKALPPDILPFTDPFVPLHKELVPFLIAVRRIWALFL
jgi:hypothetical protein